MPVSHTLTLPATCGVDPGYERGFKPKVLAAEFGDGFAQRAAAGPNSNAETRQVALTNLTATEKDAVIAFLADRGGWQSFYWQGPGEASPLVFICPEWSFTVEHVGVYSVRATFQQVYDL